MSSKIALTVTDAEVAPHVRRLPRLDGRHIVAARIEAGAVAQRHADDAKPPGIGRRRGDIDLGAIEADQRPPIGLGEAELLALSSVIGVIV